MASRIQIRGIVLGLAPLLLLSCLPSTALSVPCEKGFYFKTKSQECTKCTECSATTVVRRPCEFHHDTICRSFSSILPKESTHNPHRHKHTARHKEHHEIGESPNPKIAWVYGDDVGKPISKKNGTKEEEVEALEVSSVEAPFSGAENLVWDWQAIALTSAALACILFFLVMALYSLHQAKQWRRLQENFDADVEELSARLSLMAASSTSEKGEFQEQGIGPITTTEANYLNNRCVYLEQLLSVRKDIEVGGTKPNGNVYIEESNGKT